MVFFVAIYRYYMKIGCGLIKKCVKTYVRIIGHISNVFVLMHLVSLMVWLNRINLPSCIFLIFISNMFNTDRGMIKKHGQLVFKIYSNIIELGSGNIVYNPKQINYFQYIEYIDRNRLKSFAIN